MLFDPSVVSSSAQIVHDEVSVDFFSCSRWAKAQINGYDVWIALQKWRLEKGHFIQQMDGLKCKLIACLKIMLLFHLISGKEAILQDK